RLGVYTITANRAGEQSKDSDKFGHGVFTYYLLQALKGSADLNTDLVIRADEAYQYVATNVGRETDGTQHPQQTGRFGNRVALAQVIGGSPPTARTIASTTTDTSRTSTDVVKTTEERTSENKTDTKTDTKSDSTVESKTTSTSDTIARNSDTGKNNVDKTSNSKSRPDSGAPNINTGR